LGNNSKKEKKKRKREGYKIGDQERETKKRSRQKRNSGDSTPLGENGNSKYLDKEGCVEIRGEIEHDDFLVVRSTIVLHPIESTPKERSKKVQNIPNNSCDIELDVEDVARMGLFEFAHQFTCSK